LSVNKCAHGRAAIWLVRHYTSVRAFCRELMFAQIPKLSGKRKRRKKTPSQIISVYFPLAYGWNSNAKYTLNCRSSPQVNCPLQQ